MVIITSSFVSLINFNYVRTVMDHVMVPISVGELFDKISILVIKSERITETDKLANVKNELDLLQRVADDILENAPRELESLLKDLREINEAIWDAENVVRECDRLGKFDENFVRTSRTTYGNNDRRASTKRKINLLLGSTVIEEKSHSTPTGAGHT